VRGFLRKAGLAGTIALSLTLSATPALAAPFHGIAVAKDGDSLMVGATEVRLFGVDAPEYDQRCKRNDAAYSGGAEATERLSRLATGKNAGPYRPTEPSAK